jgi:CDP-diacylglycerol--serine O-phosphatidyltransferase
MRKVHTFSVSPNMAPPLLAGLAIGVAASIFYGYIVIMVIIVAYVIHIPFAFRTKRWIAAHPETWDDKPRQRRAIRRATRREVRQVRRTTPHRRSVARLGLRKPGAKP